MQPVPNERIRILHLVCCAPGRFPAESGEGRMRLAMDELPLNQ